MVDKKERALYLQLNGRQRKFRLTMNAIIRFKEKTGIDFMAGGKVGLEVRDVETLRSLLWAGLERDEGEEISEEQVGDWFDVGQLLNFADQIETYFRLLFPNMDMPAGNPPKARA